MTKFCRNILWSCIMAWAVGIAGRLAAQQAVDTSAAAASGDATGSDSQHKTGQNGSSSDEARGVFADAASYQNNGSFELAYNTWSRFLKKFPEDARVNEARYNAGICQLQVASTDDDGADARFEDAAKQLRAVADSTAAGTLRRDARLNLGLTYYTWAMRPADQQVTGKLLGRAVTEFSRFLNDFADAPQRDQALFYRGESQYLRRDVAAALADYRSVVAKFPDSALITDARYALGVTLEEAKQFGPAEEVYRQFLRLHGEHALVPEVTMRLGETFLQREQFAEAANQFGQAAKHPRFAQADHALFREAYCWAKSDEYARSAERFVSLVQRFPQSEYAGEATVAAARSFHRAEDEASARKWYQATLALSGTPQADLYANEAAHWLNRLRLKAGDVQQVLRLTEQRLPKAQPSGFLVQLKMDQADAWYAQAETRKQAIEAYVAIAQDHAEHPLAERARYNLAFAYMELGDYERALDVAQRALRDRVEGSPTPLDSELLSIAAESHLQLGNYRQAGELLQELRTTGPRESRAYWAVRQALALHLHGDHAGAVRLASQVLEQLTLSEQRAEAHHVLGISRLADGDARGAIAELKESLRQQAGWRRADETTLTLARAQRRVNELAEARELVRDFKERFPESRLQDEAELRSAEFAYAAEVHDEAIEMYQALLKRWPDSKWVPYALYGLGWALMKNDATDLAVPYFQRVISEFPDHSLKNPAQYGVGVALQRTGKHVEAREALMQFLKSGPQGEDEANALYLCGLCASAAKDPRASIGHFEAILSKHKDFARRDRVLYELAWARKDAGESAEAAEEFKRLADEFPDGKLAVEALYHVAEQHYEKPNYRAAAQHYTLVERHPQSAANEEITEKAIYKHGWCEFQLQSHQVALQTFREQVDRFPEGALIHDGNFMVGECLYNLKQYTEALQQYSALDPMRIREEVRPLLYLHAGQSAGQLKKWAESLKWLRSVPEQFPDSPYVHQANYEIGWAYHQTNRLDEAVRQYRLVAENVRNVIGARARFMWGEILFEQKKFASAVQQFHAVMFGYGGTKAPEPLHAWQAKSAFEAGQCAGVIARQSTNPAARKRWLGEAIRAYRYVVQNHPSSDEAEQAQNRLRQLGV